MYNDWVHILRRILLVLITTIFLLGSAIPTSASYPAGSLTQEGPEDDPPAYKVYLPAILLSTDLDLTVSEIEVTQAVQTPTNSVPLVAGRPAVARVYPQNNLAVVINGVTVSLSAHREGAELPTSPLTLGPKTVWPAWSRADINTSFNTQLPQDWLSGDVTLTATIDSENVIREAVDDNNSASIDLNFRTVPPLDVVAIPISYTDISSGRTYGPASSDYLQPALTKMYPVSAVNVSVHAPFQFNGYLNASSEWERLLSLITDRKLSEGSPSSQVYFGLVPVKNDSGNTWFYGGVAGLGWVGMYRASIGLAHTPEWGIDGEFIAAHEIGHNLGRYHSPCGVSTNEYYPYPGGIIGQFGFDSGAFSVIPNTYNDVMGYCDNVWVSDHTYEGLFYDQIAYGSAMPDQAAAQGLFIRARFDQDSSAQLQPLYVLSTLIDAPVEKSEYEVRFLDQEGRVIATHPVPLLRAEEPGIQARYISAILPLPEEAFTSIQLVGEGNTLEEGMQTRSALFKATEPQIEPSADGLILKWSPAESPALVRYTTDEGYTWTALGIDIQGGQLQIDPDTLPQGLLRFEVIPAGGAPSALSLTWRNDR